MEKEKNLTKIRLCHCGCKGALLNNENQFLSGHHIHYVRTPERNLKMKQILKRKWKDANYRNNVITGIKKALNTQEAKIKKSKISRQLWNDPQYREKVMNGLSPDGPYKCGRSTVREGYLLKLKRFADGEAVILGCCEQMHNANAAQQDAFGRTKRSSHKDNKIGKATLGAKDAPRFPVWLGFRDAADTS